MLRFMLRRNIHANSAFLMLKKNIFLLQYLIKLFLYMVSKNYAIK